MGDRNKWRVGVSRRICAFLSALATLFTAGIVAASLPQTQASAATGTSYDRTLGNASFQAARQKYGLAENMREGATLHAFEWSFKTIEENIPDIAAAGYTSVQTEPIQKIKDNRKLGTGNWYLNWYYVYQPVDMSIGNYVVGSEDDFKELCETAHKYGVRIIVDVVANHFTSDFDVIADRWRNKSYFHEDKQISDYNNREDCTQHKLSGLWDLNTQDPTVTQGMADLLKQMVADGADGFRYDAAKHIELPDEVFGGKTSNYWNTILQNGAQYQYGEVLEDANVREADYADLFWNSSTGKGGITDSSFGHEVRNGVQHGSLSASHFTQHNKVTEDKSVNWVESHDNFANGEANIPQELDDEWIMYGWAGITAQKNGMTLFFDRPYKDGGTYGTGGKGTYGNGSGPFTENSKLGDAGDDMWKDPRIVAVNHFRNSMIGENSNVSNCGDDLCLMVERYAGSSAQDGVVVANANDSDKSLAGTSTKLANGTYKDEVTGSTLTVSGGTITSGTVKAKSVAAFSNKTRNPIVSTAEAYPNKGTIPGTSKKITLRAYQATNTTYSVSDGQSGSYKDGDVITIGANASGGAVITVTVKGTAADGSSIEHTYSYVKFGDPTWDPSDGTESPCDKYCVTYLQKNGWNADTYIDAEEPNFTGSRSRVQPTGVTISGDDVSNGTVTRDISTGNDTARLKATVAPEGASQTVTWSSSDSSVASVDSTGTVTMLKAGTATITATTTNSLSASVTVTVTGQVTPVESVSVTPTSLDMLKGDTAQLTATVAPSTATVKRITWSSSDSSVASVDSTGKVTAVKRGTATITATSNNGKTATVPVTVTSAVNNIIYVTKPSGWSTVYAYVYASSGTSAVPNAAWPGVALTQMTSDDSCAKSGTYMYEVPDDLAEDSQVIFSDKGSNQYPASQQPGLAYTGGAVTWASGQSSFTEATCTPSTVAVTSVTLNQSALTLTEGGSATLTATVAPSNATDKTITWSSSDSSVATVSGGVVTAVKAGTATIAATASNGKSASATVTVKAKTPERIDVTGVTISTDSLELVEGQNGTLTASVAPSNATDKTITWESSDPSVATVNGGVVTAVKAGTATITATSSNGKTATCTVTVKAKTPERIDVTGVTISTDSLELVEGQNGTLTASVAPSNATDKTITWSSSDDSVATVNNGIVTAVKEGGAIIKATASNGKYAQAVVTVKAKAPEIVDVKQIIVQPGTSTLTVGASQQLSAIVLPNNATNKTVTWKSNNASVAIVDQNGLATAVGEGSTQIVATSADGKISGYATVIVSKSQTTVDVTSVTLNKSALALTEGSSETLTATVAPSNATDKTVTWRSSDSSVATVSANGTVTAVKAGTATITATAGGKSATCTLTVNPATVPVTGVTVSPGSASVTVGQTTQLAAVVAPSNATNKAVSWYSETPSVATVDANGL
ncbi:Ig-like domain-containing protein, partial [Pseudoscardovia radai]|uniref:Ig-like domain-containing protein n=1 Tax=Pseudoscardovia radai TaxID=987066 RepID=UPI003994C45B